MPAQNTPGHDALTQIPQLCSLRVVRYCQISLHGDVVPAGQTGTTAARGSDSEREKMLFGFSSWLGSQLKSSDCHTPF